jgi:hypothetical protein
MDRGPAVPHGHEPHFCYFVFGYVCVRCVKKGRLLMRGPAVVGVRVVLPLSNEYFLLFVSTTIYFTSPMLVRRKR